MVGHRTRDLRIDLPRALYKFCHFIIIGRLYKNSPSRSSYSLYH